MVATDASALVIVVVSVFEPSGEKFDPLNVEIRTLMRVIKKTPMILKVENLFAAFICVFCRRL